MIGMCFSLTQRWPYLVLKPHNHNNSQLKLWMATIIAFFSSLFRTIVDIWSIFLIITSFILHNKWQVLPLLHVVVMLHGHTGGRLSFHLLYLAVTNASGWFERARRKQPVKRRWGLIWLLAHGRTACFEFGSQIEERISWSHTNNWETRRY